MMGVDVIGQLLRDAAPIAVASIKAGMMPEDQALPAILVRSVSVIDAQWLQHGPIVRSTERVAVTVRAANYRDQVALAKQVRAICAGMLLPMLGDAARVSIRTAGLGPDVIGPGNTFEQTQDFRVTYDAPA